MLDIFALEIAAYKQSRLPILELLEQRYPSISVRFRTPTGKEPAPVPCVVAADIPENLASDMRFLQFVCELDGELHKVA